MESSVYPELKAKMPAKDIYHDRCKNALIADGWTITHDPQPVFNELFEEAIGKLLLDRRIINLLVFNPDREVIVRWIN